MNLVVQPLRKEPMMFTQSIKPAWAICAVVLLGSTGFNQSDCSARCLATGAGAFRPWTSSELYGRGT